MNEGGSYHVVGEVTNLGDGTANSIKVSGAFYDYNNRVTGDGVAYVTPDRLSPGQTAPFDISVESAPNQQIAFASYNTQSQEYSMINNALPNTPSTSPASPKAANCNEHCQFEINIAKERDVTKETNSDTAFLEIDYGGGWQGSILDSNSTSTSHDGVGIGTISFPCTDGSVYSVDVQKQENSGTLHIKVVKQGNILKDAETSAAYGVVAISGTC